jgi:predicted transcriptional regulator
VGDDGTVEGVITLQRINALPRARWHTVTSGQAMTPLAAMPQASPDDGVLALLRRMEETDVDRLPLVEHDHLVGTVSRERLLRYIRTRSEMSEVRV